jgi:hypothetical protein
MRRNLAILNWTGLMLLCAACQLMRAAEVTVVTLEGDEQKGALQDVSAAGFKVDGKIINMSDVAEVRFSAPQPASGITLHLRNGDELKVVVVSGDDSKLKVRNAALGELEISSQFWHALVFTPKDGPGPGVIEEFLKAAPSQEDLILQPKGDTLSGIFEKFSDKEISFNAGGATKPYAYDSLAAFRMAPVKEYTAPTDFRATLVLRDGSKITGKLAALKNGKLSFEAIDGTTWSLGVDALQSIFFQGGKLAYLSDLQPASVEQKSYVGGMPFIHGWRRDQAVTGEKMVINNTPFARGIGVHSFSKLSYDLDGKYAKFLCQAGLDATAQGDPVAAWSVRVDGKEAAKGLAKPASAPEMIKLDVAGAKHLELICDYGPDDDDAGDHLNWANARLIKP